MAARKTLLPQVREPWLNRNLVALLGLTLAIAFIAIIVVLFFYACHFSVSLSDDSSVWGQFGDYMGGTLNPILSFLALISLLFTLWVQSQSLDTARKQIARQNEVAALSAEITAISVLIESLNRQIEQDSVAASVGHDSHLEANRERLDRRTKLLERLYVVYEQLVGVQNE